MDELDYQYKIKKLQYDLDVERLISQCLLEINMIRHNEINVKKFFVQQEINSVAIYGIGKIGKSLYDLLIDNGINVKYCFDRDINACINGCETRHVIQDITNDVDYMIITSELQYEQIKNKINEVTNVNTIIVRDLLEDMMLIPIGE